MIAVRTALFAAGLFGAMVISPWAAVFAIAILALIARSPEALFLGLIVDLVWLPPGHLPFFTIGAIAALWLLEPARHALRLSRE